MEIQGKVALITGASRGIGRAIALELAQLGIQKLILVARDRQKLVEVANEIEAMGTETAIVALDLTQTIEVNIAVAQLWRNYGQIHLLVNCAGVAYQSSFLQSKMPQVQEELSVNLFGMYNLTSLIARRMASQRQGTIVNVSSLMGKVAAPTMATYSATKFAILGFTQALRRELADYNIRVIALLPSLTDTDMMHDLKLFRWVIPMTPQQVAKALVTGMQNDSAEILVGWQSHLAVLCQRLAPWLLELILRIATPPASTKQQPRERLNKLIPKLSFLTRIHRFGDLFLSRT
ncbi:SDR family NAD(P)-dependent oxidoreductase [Nostoc sp.]|uniref:SDR family NAD(P)-dependent oxidoreductase n=1 Tax=Nostoc sp. TaxID=1180 RepID=UPI002FF5F24D